MRLIRQRKSAGPLRQTNGVLKRGKEIQWSIKMPEKPLSEPVASIWPLILAAGIAMLVIGLMAGLVLSLIGVILIIFALGGWTQENRILTPYLEEHEDEEPEHE